MSRDRLHLGGLGIVIALEVLRPAFWTALAPWLALTAIAVAVPHGAWDDHLAAASTGASPRRTWLAYLGVVLAVLALGWWWPGAVFAVFLAVAAFHFGESELPAGQGPGAACLRGLTYVSLLLAAGARDPAVAGSLATLGVVLPAPSLAIATGVVAGCAHLAWHRPSSSPRFVMQALLLLVAGPWIGFATYFAGHALDHLREAQGRLPRKAWLRAALHGGGPVLVALGAHAFLDSPRVELAPLLVVGLAAVTIPHAVAFHLAFRRQPTRVCAY